MKFNEILFFHIGRTRLEPIIIIILSIVMCAASFQVIFEGVRSIIEDVGYFRNVSGYAYEKPPVDINPAAISIMCITIGKLFFVQIEIFIVDIFLLEK
jgi:divalent metal cation (Fe/Co/Zn/Cd) transporter